MKKLHYLLFTFLLIGCVPNINKLSLIELDMTRNEVEKQLGSPPVIRGSIKNKYNQTIVVWEYQFAEYKAGAPARAYWLFFVDDILVQWGEAGDWQYTQTQLYEIKFTNDK